LFYSGVKGLSHPSTARRGNAFGMIGMVVAVATTIALIFKLKTEAAGGGLVMAWSRWE
jgi:NAD(P) transhydrogenase subunit beta